MAISNTPTYNLKVVIKETGIAADTLRAWERRYGLPMPERSPGGHRLYSKRDIEIIKWLMEKQREGLSISRAIDLWNELSASGQDPLPAFLSGTTPIPQVTSTPSANLDSVRKQWLDACLTFNEDTAEQLLNQAFALYPLESVCIEVLQKGLIEIGDMWYRDRATIQQEHFTSALAHRRLDTLISAIPPHTRQETIVIGCPAKEQHTFTPLLLTLLLRRRGLNVVYLGANVPSQQFEKTIQAIRPHLVIMSAQLLQTASGLKETVEYLNAKGAQVAYGGRIFNQLPELRTRIPAHFLGTSIQEAIQSVENLLTSNTPLQETVPVNEQDQKLSKVFIRNHPMIEMYALTETHKIGIPIEFSSVAIQQLGNNIISALALGNVDALTAEMEWIHGLMSEHNQDPKNLSVFLTAYAKSVDSALGKEGQSISSWLRTQANSK